MLTQLSLHREGSLSAIKNVEEVVAQLITEGEEAGYNIENVEVSIDKNVNHYAAHITFLKRGRNDKIC